MKHMQHKHGSGVREFREPGGVKCREYKGETKSVKRIKSKVETVKSVSESSASLRRITPSAQVGRLSESHSDIGFQLIQFPTWKKSDGTAR